MAENRVCIACENVGFSLSDGYYYCDNCCSKAEDLVETGVGDEDYEEFTTNKINCGTFRTVVSKSEPRTQESQIWDLQDPKQQYEDVDDHKTTPPRDFGTVPLGFNDYSTGVRLRYVTGIQLMIQYQCEALVEKFQVSPLICGLSAAIWMKFVVSSRVFDKDWADNTLVESERQGEEERNEQSRYRAEPHNIHGERAVVIWIRSLQKKIPISTSLAISFLACHVAREPILSTDILKWTLDGNLPYFNAFIRIEEDFKQPSTVCPLSPNFMFRPLQALKPMVLESQAGFVGLSIGLELPPLNFYAVACRYLKQLTLSKEKILPLACRLYEWLMPPDLWLSANSHKLSTRVCVMSILIVTIRILYNINGFGKWESKLSSLSKSRKRRTDSNGCSQSSIAEHNCEVLKTLTSKVRKRNGGDANKCCVYGPNIKQPTETQSKDKNTSAEPKLVQHSELDTSELLLKLEATYDNLLEESECLEELPAYLKFCKDIIFAEPASSRPVYDKSPEEQLVKQLSNLYEKQEDKKVEVGCCKCPNQNRSMMKESLGTDSVGNKVPSVDYILKRSLSTGNIRHSDLQDQTLQASNKALRRLKLDMEDNKFHYIPPRVNPKRFDYLHYARKNDEGTREYVAHADYYILLRACAKVVVVDIRYMHAAVLKLEKRLAWIENQVDHNLQLWIQSFSCSPGDDTEDAMNLDDSLDFPNFQFKKPFS